MRRLFSTFFQKLDSSKLIIQKTKNKLPKVPKEELRFGQTLSDHMLEIDWVSHQGWTAPRIVPLHDLCLSPAASVFHYSTECFEGLKAYLDKEDNIRLFRIDKNMERFNNSLHRLALPTVDGNELSKCIQELVKVDKDWIPRGKDYSLYVRPTAIGTQAGLGVAPSRALKIFVITSPVGPYYPQGFKPVKLLADTKYVRAWPGGTGGNKVGGNYGLSIAAQVEAAKKGYSQILWLFGSDMQVTEVGTMNIFFVWRTQNGKKEIITAPLDGTILPGVTRDSVLSLVRGWGSEWEVSERHFTIYDVIKAIEEKRIMEAFGAGTAAVVAPVEGFSFKDTYYPIPVDEKDPKAVIGPVAKKIHKSLLDIQYGEVGAHPWSVVVK